jgi:hypothetical protein
VRSTRADTRNTKNCFCTVFNNQQLTTAPKCTNALNLQNICSSLDFSHMLFFRIALVSISHRQHPLERFFLTNTTKVLNGSCPGFNFTNRGAFCLVAEHVKRSLNAMNDEPFNFRWRKGGWSVRSEKKRREENGILP